MYKPTVTLFGTIGNVFPVWGPVRLPVISWSRSNTHWVAASDLLYPYIEFSSAIETICDETAVG